MHSQIAENVNSPAASSIFFNGIADSLAAIIGSMSVAFAFGWNAGMSLRVSAQQVSPTPQVMPLSAKQRRRRPVLSRRVYAFIAAKTSFFLRRTAQRSLT
ncbi:MAG: hypothetical protein WCD24_12830 [Serratia inhibens]|uniref:hypothetical protein n=1 Tax=Serratia inhibens TaxID=2338073 RepID=UPI003C7ACDA2